MNINRLYKNNNKYLFVFLFTLSLILFLLLIFYYNIHDLVIESYYNISTDKIPMDESNFLSLDDFNAKFDTDIVNLPKNIIAIGAIDNDFFYHKQKICYDISGNDTFIHYLINIRPFINKPKFYLLFCYYDGFMSGIPCVYPCNNTQKSIPVVVDKDKYLDNCEIYEIEDNMFPILHKNKYMFTNSKRIIDEYSICVPDLHYLIGGGHIEYLEGVDSYNTKYEDKIEECIWRGNISNSSKYNFINYGDKYLTQREHFKKMYEDNQFNKINYDNTLTSLQDQLKYKYILDIDGFVNTWSATIWKLYSGSVLLKVKSIWEQWYYADFKEYIHYVPVENDFSDLNTQIQWCIDNDDKCKIIIANAKQLVIDKLNWETVKQDAIDIFNKYL